MSPTKVLAGAIVSVALLVPSLSAQNHRRDIFSTPDVPDKASLARLNLHQAWRNSVPMDGRKDGFLRIEFDGKDMIALTRSGLVTRIDPETGVPIWRTRVGKPYTLLPYISANRRTIYIIATATLHALDRETGAEKWSHPLSGGISAGPGVDKTRLFVPTASSNLYAFSLPFVSTVGSETGSPGEVRRESPVYAGGLGEDFDPRPVWVARTNLLLSHRPLVSKREVLVVSPDGKGIGYHKTPRAAGVPAELFAFDLNHKITVPPTSFGDTAYIGCDDATLYAVNMQNGRMRWRHTAGTSITRSPVILDTDIFFTSEHEGLARLDRVSGDAMWKVPYGRLLLEGNRGADRFLAANDRFVYATDHSGRLLVLDRKRGTKLSMLDTSAFRFPVVNNVTDRLYLAANDGLIVCLHDRDQREPLQVRKLLEEATMQKILDQKVTEASGKEIPIREALVAIEDKYDVDFVLDNRAFADAKVPVPEGKMVKPPAIDGKPLKDYLTGILSQVGMDYRLDQEAVHLIPLKPKAPKEK